ncbi:TPA: polysaccharide biosynthesis tyrosine autokinase [Klebsiella pneumoniae]|nr:polysaccharide biosynthesis tyrosine autokinase [Klebsiella pneumoniae]
MSSAIKKPNTTDTNDIDLGRLIGELIDHRKLIISITSLFTLIALIYILFATPIYQADAMIQVEKKQANAILSNLSDILPNGQPQSAPEIALLQSRMIIGKTVDDLNLQTIIEKKHFPIFGRGWSRLIGVNDGDINISLFKIESTGESLPLIFNIEVIDKTHYKFSGDGVEFEGVVGQLEQNSGVSIKVTSIEANPGDEFSLTYITRLKAITNLQNNFIVMDEGKDSGILTLTLTGDNPAQVKRIIDHISYNYLVQNIAREAAQDAKSLDFLNQQLPQVRNDLDRAEDKLNAYRRQSDSVDLSLEAKSVLDQIVNVDNQLNALTFREAEVSQLYTKEHPTYKALLEKRKTLQEEKGKLNKKVAGMPKTQQEILRLNRDVDSGRAIYMQLLNRQQELSIAKSSAIGNVRIIDEGVTQPKPVKPNKILVVLLGIMLGGMFSVVIVLVRVFLRRGIETPEQLEELGINVYASIPLAERNTKTARYNKGIFEGKHQIQDLLAIDNPADLAIEAIRGLRTSLHFAMMEARNNVLMISGASPNAGKTFVSSNLAAIIAQTGQKVLFIDADLRKGYSHKLFKVDNDKGLSDFLSGQVKSEHIIKNVSSVGFDFIPRGMIPPNPAELLMHKKFEELINWANEHYDLVLVDTPPILAVTDAAIIGNYVGTTLLVTRFEQNTAKEIEVSIKRYEQSGILVKGCILNGIVKKSSSYYGYGYSHYGYSYTEDN